MKKIWAIFGRLAYILAWPSLYFYLKDTERSRVIVKAEGKILMVKDWLGDGSWKLPGGGVHKGEPIAASACRELYEETGMRVEPSDLISAGTIVSTSHGATMKLHIFRLNLPTAVRVLKQKGEIVDIGWQLSEDLISLGKVSKTTLAVLQKIQ